jgi:catechol 2,3-dioxygenase-like lactoylglutathione lyase family enzyme
MTRREFARCLGGVALIRPSLVAQQAPARPAIQAQTLNHVALRVSDVKRTADWYQRLFGMEAQFRPQPAGGSVAVLKVGRGPEFIALYPANGAKPGFMHMGFGVPNFVRTSIDQALAAHGVKGEWTVRSAAGGDVEELMVRDPDNLPIQLQDVRYSGGGGRLGDTWPQPWSMPPKDGKPPIPLRCINHVTFGSSSQERAERFYRDLFSLPMLSWDYRPAEPSKILGLGTGSPRSFIAPGQGRNIGVSHYCLGVEKFERERVAQALAEHGVTVQPATKARPGCCGSKVEYSATETVFTRDPDNFSVQLTDMDYCAGTGPIGTVCIT